jgi:hypothetical protein
MKDKLLEAQDRHKDNANKSWKAHPVINIRNKVWLLCRNLKTNCPCDKLDFRCRIFFSVVKQIKDVAFCLKLPPSMKIHLVFHVSLLEPYKESSISAKFQVPPPPIEIEGQEEFEVLEILDSRIIWKKLEYLDKQKGLIKSWQRYNVNEKTWELVARND